MMFNERTGDLDPAAVRSAAYALLRREPDHRAAHLRLYEVEQMLGMPAAAVAHLRAALRTSPVVAGAATGSVRVLALSRIAAWEANIPLELVVDERRIALIRLYLDGSEDPATLVARLPAHDVLVNAIAESDAAQPALALAARIVAALDVPCVNDPSRVRGLSRDRVAASFAGSSAVLAARAERMTPDALRTRAIEGPLIVRPVGSQAGAGLERVGDAAGVRAYLEHVEAPFFYVTPFVDYRSADGWYRKYRVMFVDGRPLPCHLAISPRWMIHYYNAPMAEHAWMRDEEAAFLAGLDAVFDGSRAHALREIAEAVTLPYFGIDCALMPDGRVLLFEADVAMLVHDSDPVDVYPYKHAAFVRIQSALTGLLERARAG